MLLVMKEEWRPVVGYEGLYEVSSFGRVKRLKRTIIRRNGMRLPISERILVPYDFMGYARIGLCKKLRRKHLLVHRLVAIAFIPNPNCLSLINHKDEIRSNNHIDNLEWCTREYNLSYGDAPRKLKEHQLSLGKRVIQMRRDGTEITTFVSASEAARMLKLCGSCISKVCRGERGTAGGYKFKYF